MFDIITVNYRQVMHTKGFKVSHSLALYALFFNWRFSPPLFFKIKIHLNTATHVL